MQPQRLGGHRCATSSGGGRDCPSFRSGVRAHATTPLAFALGTFHDGAASCDWCWVLGVGARVRVRTGLGADSREERRSVGSGRWNQRPAVPPSSGSCAGAGVLGRGTDGDARIRNADKLSAQQSAASSELTATGPGAEQHGDRRRWASARGNKRCGCGPARFPHRPWWRYRQQCAVEPSPPGQRRVPRTQWQQTDTPQKGPARPNPDPGGARRRVP